MVNMPATWNFSEFRDPDALLYIDAYSDLHQDESNARERAVSGIFKVGRDNSRTPMQWSTDPNSGFTGNNPSWMSVNPSYTWLNVEAQKTDIDSIWNFWKARIAMRKQYRELFMFGTFAVYDYDNPDTFTYTKMTTDGQQALVILNFSKEDVPLNTIQRHLLGHTYTLLASNYAELKPNLQAWEGRVYIVREASKAEAAGSDVSSEVQDRLPSWIGSGSPSQS